MTEVGGAAMVAWAGASGVIDSVRSVADVPGVVVSWWPLIAAVGVGLIMYGELRSKVRELEHKAGSAVKVPERLSALEAKMDILITQLQHAIERRSAYREP
jgi:hypothetical protein